jgi:hypothetical protein
MIASIRFSISDTHTLRVRSVQNCLCSTIVAMFLISMALVGYVPSCSAQNIPTPQGVSICDDPGARGSASYDKYCGACYPRCGNTGSLQRDNGAAQAAAAVAAQKHRDVEREQERIEAENRRRLEEAAKQAKFNQDKREALGQLKGISNGGNFDSDSGLKGVYSTESGLKDVPNSGDSLVLKTLPDVNSATHVAVIDSPSDQKKAARILAGIRKIKVPPPVLPEDALLSFGQLVPDEKSKRIIEGAEFGVAIFDIAGKLENVSFANKILFSTGKTLIAAENGADVYIVKQNATYEKALAYLKDAKERQKFVEIVRDLREKKPLPEDASIDMARAAQAILDPELGNSGIHIAWDALLSPEARRAALTQACIELVGHAVGAASEAAVGRIVAARQPAFQEASDFLSHAGVALQTVKDPKAIESLNLAVKQANEMIAASYEVAEPAGKMAGDFTHSLFTSVAEKAAEHSLEDKKNQ